MIVGIKTHFDAAHYLPGYEGKCKNMHGHRWVVEIEVQGPRKLETGMVIDFAILKEYTKQQVEDRYDHRLLNDFFIATPPTAENIAYQIFQDLDFLLDKGPVVLHKVKVFETPDSWVEVKNDPI